MKNPTANKNNNTNKTIVNNMPFNMTIAKLISNGSVDGKIIFVGCDGVSTGRAKYSHESDGKHVFEIFRDETETSYTGLESFDDFGHCIFDDGSIGQLKLEVPAQNPCNEVKQEKDSHYHKCKIEPIDYILANDLGFCEGNVVKYITRYKDKGGIDDLRKIKVYVDFLIDNLTK